MSELKAERPVPQAEALPELAAQAPGTSVDEDPDTGTAPPRRSRKRLLAGVALLAVLAGGGYFGWHYWTVGRFQESTDDAYVQADVVTVAPKVGGYIGAVLVGDNETVHKGQVLARIDDRDYQVALHQAQADVSGARADIANIEALLDQQKAVIDGAQATLDTDKANETFAEQDSTRYNTLAKSGFGSLQNAQQATAKIAAAKATVQKDEAALVASQKQVNTLNAQLDKAKATLAHNEALLQQAQLNLSYTKIVAPEDGVVGNRSLRVGQFVQAGTQLMALVPLQGAYIIANFKETQLTDVRKGQKVSIEVDTFPGADITGHVDSVAPASGQVFALLPPDNATGNFTKIVQRIPVKITIDPDSPLAGRLRPGMSVVPTVTVKPVQQSTADAS
ncbi:HlyD family secretion protein [Roseixanthobacter glucoisosaccharinicivorans]|uniref:HlyD family secretion protein n=1 Tax=Roseixanthobacter glucoisosaccharinicivorans TaxID=3119923 RepID=UPI00372AF10E